MSNFEEFYRTVDLLNLAIRKAETYLSTHPAETVELTLPPDMCRKYDLTVPKDEGQLMRLICYTTPELNQGEIFVEFYSVENGEWDTFRLVEASLESRIMFAPFIPKLIELADASLVHKAEHVLSTIQDIEHAISVSEASRKPKTKSGKKTKQ
jgi:hypothetical protein